MAAGQQPGEEELVALFAARGPEVRAVAEVADDLRRQAVGDVVTFVRNRNINYTNVCTFRCRFCAFSKGPASLNLRGAPYLLGLDEVARRVVEADQRGATEVTLQGGIHPSFDGDYYLHVAEAVHEAVPGMHIHGFTALEVHEGARRLGEPLRDYLLRLKSAGLASLPGTAAEILDDEVRAVICPDKVTTEEWLEVHRVAHSVGLRSNITIMFGHVESPRHWARHLLRTRDLQAETGGFTEFVPLPFVHMAAPMYRKRQSRPGPTFREAVLIHAVARIAYRGLIDNIQVSWVKMGAEGVRQALLAGVNDLGGTLMDENISRAAGAAHGQLMEEAEFRSIVEPLGRRLEQRTTLYGRTRTEPRRRRFRSYPVISDDAVEQGLVHPVGERDPDQGPAEHESALLSTSRRPFRPGGGRLGLAAATARGSARGPAGSGSWPRIRPPGPDHGQQRPAGRPSAVSVPGLPWASRKRLTICGPATPAADQAVSSRPWIAPTW